MATLLKEQEPQFRRAVDELIAAIAEDEDRAVERMAMARYTGQYGPTWLFGSREIQDKHRSPPRSGPVPGTQRYLYRNCSIG